MPPLPARTPPPSVTEDEEDSDDDGVAPPEEEDAPPPPPPQEAPHSADVLSESVHVSPSGDIDIEISMTRGSSVPLPSAGVQEAKESKKQVDTLDAGTGTELDELCDLVRSRPQTFGAGLAQFRSLCAAIGTAGTTGLTPWRVAHALNVMGLALPMRQVERIATSLNERYGSHLFIDTLVADLMAKMSDDAARIAVLKGEDASPQQQLFAGKRLLQRELW